ncbi:MAG: small ribosomal subunit biogenesis GTPase RsgA [Succinivibrionaceae bacterium]
MAKNIKLSHKQFRNVKARHSKLINNAHNLSEDNTTINQSNLGPLMDGTIVSRYGKQVDVEDNKTRIIYRCYIRRTIESLTTGDAVLFRIDITNNEQQNGLVETVKPRTSLLSRPDYYDGLKPIVANISKIIIVNAKEPEFSTNILDRYLIACAKAQLSPIIIINKADLFTDDEKTELEKTLNVYKNLGYKTLLVSTQTQEGISELLNLIENENTVLVGQSGVGKTSLLNVLVPTAYANTNEISQTSGLGQHTTTNTKLYHLDNGGLIIDSPGIREFALWHLTNEEVTKSYKEFTPYIGCCKFRDCKHNENEPGCAIVDAVKNGKISQFRYDNYLKIIESMSNNKPSVYVEPGKKYKK